MSWRYPEVLFLFLLMAIVYLVSAWIQSKRDPLFTSAQKRLVDVLFSKVDRAKSKWKQRFISLGVGFLIVSAAGPQIGIRVKPIERKGVDLVFAVDVSSSMDAEDVVPSRLEKAKYEIGQVVRHLEGDRVAFIVFAGSSHLYLPLTSDYEAALLFLDAIDTDMIPTQGTSLASALNTGISAFGEESEKYKVLVLVTDGEDHEGEAIAIAEKAQKTGFTIHSIGVGTSTGSLIPLKTKKGLRAEYKKDKQGRLITSVLNETILRDIANAGGGIFIRFDNRLATYRDLMKAIDQMEKKTISTHEFSEYEDRYHLFGVLSFLTLVIGFTYPTRRYDQ